MSPSTATFSSSPLKATRAAWTAVPRASRTPSARSAFAASASSTSPTSHIHAASRTCRPAAGRTRTRSSSIPMTVTTCTCTSPGRQAFVRRASCPDAFTIRTIRTRRNSASRSSRFRSRIPSTGASPEDRAAMDAARARGEFIVSIFGQDQILPGQMTRVMLDSVVKARGGAGAAAATGADSAALRGALPGIIARMLGQRNAPNAARPGVTSCHDITVYPAIGRAGGACEGYGLLLDIRDLAHPARLFAVSDTNFSYWHSATFNNDGTKLLFSDEWGGGGAPKCRAGDPTEWGSDAIFAIEDNKLVFQSYYKLPAVQTPQENCVAHNGSLIPIPGRDVMVQAWYQGGISVFDWTDARHPREIAFFDRGPVDSTRMAMGGSWSVYWYNGAIVSSEIARGLDIVALTPSPFLSQNEIDAANTVHLDYLNTQGQPKLVWPTTFALARAYVDQLERTRGLSADRIAAARQALNGMNGTSGASRREALTQLASRLDSDASGSDAAKIRTLVVVVRDLASH